MADVDVVQRTARTGRVIEQALKGAELEWESPEPGSYVVTLPGTRKLSTTCSLRVGRHALSVNAFVIRHPDENEQGVHRWLLERNLKLYGVSYAVDALGDIYLAGKLPLAAVTEDEIDRLLGSVLEAADGSFNTLLELGFASAIRKEHAWRVSRGESTRNLDAFAHLTRRGEAADTPEAAGAHQAVTRGPPPPGRPRFRT
ncbi:YbjN domain-containing protein [Streptomyces sp. NPDC101062]|uniref:YbjN domain-containing protein n=1 Tax=unclassified Streptomyces TaxID=2593676 RepID=UPI0038228FE2